MRAQTGAIFSNFVDLPDQPGCGEIGERVRAPGTRAVARVQVVSGSEREPKSRELVDDEYGQFAVCANRGQNRSVQTRTRAPTTGVEEGRLG